jgi:hypothetical protein
MSHFVRALATNSTATAFTAQTPTLTEPSGTGKFDLNNYLIDGRLPTHIELVFFGTDGDNDTGDCRVYIWNRSEDGVYVPRLLLDASLVFGNIAASDIAANTFMVDTITQNDGPAAGTYWQSIIDCQEDMVGSIIVGLRGARYLSFDFDRVGGQEAASLNAYWRGILL